METINTQGISIPRLGLGTYRMPGSEAQSMIETAISVGFRHIDTATMYETEAAVGDAVAASSLSRGEFFITTKVWHDKLSPEALKRSCEESLSKLRTGYVDLYMIHWPAADMDMAATLGTMMRLREEGLVKAIGVCNFNLPMIRCAVEHIGTPIASHQVEYHPFLSQAPMLEYLASKGIPMTAYAPLAQGRAAQDPVLAEIGRKHGVGAAEIAIAWLLDQPNVAVIPKAARIATQEADLAAIKIRLDDEDRAAIANLPKDRRYVRPPFAPDWDVA
jgi:2,5-diketo-D-gluconate reductase B